MRSQVRRWQPVCMGQQQHTLVDSVGHRGLVPACCDASLAVPSLLTYLGKYLEPESLLAACLLRVSRQARAWHAWGNKRTWISMTSSCPTGSMRSARSMSRSCCRPALACKAAAVSCEARPLETHNLVTKLFMNVCGKRTNWQACARQTQQHNR